MSDESGNVRRELTPKDLSLATKMNHENTIFATTLSNMSIVVGIDELCFMACQQFSVPFFDYCLGVILAGGLLSCLEKTV